MYFNFEDNHPDIAPVGHAISWREAALMTVIFHLLAAIGILTLPSLDSGREARIAQMAELQRQRELDRTRFVFIQPHLDMPATRAVSPNADASDKDRNVRSIERAPNPKNSLPFSRGNTPERVEELSAPAPRPGPSAQPQPSSDPSNAEAGSPPPAPSTGSLTVPGLRAGTGRMPDATGDSGMGGGRGLLGSAMRDLRQMVRQNVFDNQDGGGGDGRDQSIQFDSKGVEFGPWVRRFIAQVRRNWNIPYAAMSLKGHVVVKFVIAKNGTISGLVVADPSNVDGFNKAAYGAVAASNPTYPLPAEYPDDHCAFTIIFYYNELPPGR